jgi:hypothetical protein
MPSISMACCSSRPASRPTAIQHGLQARLKPRPTYTVDTLHDLRAQPSSKARERQHQPVSQDPRRPSAILPGKHLSRRPVVPDRGRQRADRLTGPAACYSCGLATETVRLAGCTGHAILLSYLPGARAVQAHGALHLAQHDGAAGPCGADCRLCSNAARSGFAGPGAGEDAETCTAPATSERGGPPGPGAPPSPGRASRSAARGHGRRRRSSCSPLPHPQPPGQGSGPAACIGHRRPQPTARHSERHEHGHDDDQAGGHALLR